VRPRSPPPAADRALALLALRPLSPTLGFEDETRGRWVQSESAPETSSKSRSRDDRAEVRLTMLVSALDERALACTCKKPECVEAIYHRYGPGAAIRGNEGTVVSSPRRLGWAEPLVYAPLIMDWALGAREH
jgi:hypothetical protein